MIPVAPLLILGVWALAGGPNRFMMYLAPFIGIGAGVIDRLREQGYDAQAVNFGLKLNSIRYLNTRAYCHWKVREALNPESENPLAIPEKFSRLVTELIAIEHTFNSSGQIQIEPKENVKKKLGHSPDQADALAISYDNPVGRILRLVFGSGKGRFYFA